MLQLQRQSLISLPTIWCECRSWDDLIGHVDGRGVRIAAVQELTTASVLWPGLHGTNSIACSPFRTRQHNLWSVLRNTIVDHIKAYADGPPSLASGFATRPVQAVYADVDVQLQGAARTHTDVSRRFVPTSRVSRKPTEAAVRSATRGDLVMVTRPTSTYFGARSFTVAGPTA